MAIKLKVFNKFEKSNENGQYLFNSNKLFPRHCESGRRQNHYSFHEKSTDSLGIKHFTVPNRQYWQTVDKF